MKLREQLEREVDGWEQIGHPAILQRFVLRNGREFQRAPDKLRMGKSGLCFMNAYHVMDRGAGTYVEGFAKRSGVPIPIHHAWACISGEAVDTTWPVRNLRGDLSTFEYIGVEFSEEIVRRQVAATGYYGLLAGPTNYNVDFMFEIDPGLREIVDEIMKKERAA